MDVRGEDNNSIQPPMEPDEGWWAAVLADEPLDEPEVDAAVTPPVGKNDFGDLASSWVNWDRILQVYQGDEIVDLNVVGYNRGGLLVAGEDIHGFVPASHLIDVPAEAREDEREVYFTPYLDRNISLKIIECEPEKERVVFSERAALAGEGQRRHLLSSLQSGDVVDGLVTNVTNFGAFVDLGGLEGLIHVSELSWGRVQHPADILQVGDQVKTLILQVAEDKGRIALSLKRLEPNPWDLLAENLTPGDSVPATISSIVKYGAFARLEEGVEGLIHISSMNFPNGCTHIDDFLYEGQAVNVCILHIDPRKRRLGLKLESYTA
ncbi:MAG: S1 RNA-binding domain-containing protein [Chloroflexota bacterium]|nr:S1 RNA-binding domain-containing protein [Chloroflexota bacterium]